MMKLFRSIPLLILVLLVACTTSEQEEPTEAEARYDTLEQYEDLTEADSISTPEEVLPRPVVRFICRDIGQGLDNPLYEVSLLVGTSYFTLDTIHTCQSIRYADFEEYEIPRSALSAAGGWWKNAGDYFFAIEEPGEIVVMHAWQTEEQSVQGYFYKEKRRILLPEPEPLEDM